MIKEEVIICHDIICDKCGAKMTTEDSEWITIGENHYCPNCYEFIFYWTNINQRNKTKYETNNRN